MSYPQDFFGSSPKAVLNKPFFHTQDQKAYNVDGGASIADAWTMRALNTVITNDIQGASLSSNQVNLPAGTYYVEAYGIHKDTAGCKVVVAIFKDGVKVLQGNTAYVGAAESQFGVSGCVTLTSSGVIDFRYYSGTATATLGLGVSNNGGSVVDTTIPSIYADLKIWQLDRSLEIAPKTINSGIQTIAGMNTEGGIMGGDVTVSGNTLTVTKTSCMDSNLDIAMATTANTAVVLPATVNQDFYIFIVRLVSGGTFTMKAYTTFAGPSSDVLVDRWRFISYAKNNASGVTMPYMQVGKRIDWLVESNRPIVGTITATLASYTISSILPLTNLFEVGLAKADASSYGMALSYDGTTVVVDDWVDVLSMLPISPVYLKTYTGFTAVIHVAFITLRR